MDQVHSIFFYTQSLDLLTFVQRTVICPLIIKKLHWSNLQDVKEYVFENEIYFHISVESDLIFLSAPFGLLSGLLAVIDAHNTSYKETKQGETPGASSDLNRLDKDPIYVGGLPRSRVIRYGITWQNFLVPDYWLYSFPRAAITWGFKQQLCPLTL